MNVKKWGAIAALSVGLANSALATPINPNLGVLDNTVVNFAGASLGPFSDVFTFSLTGFDGDAIGGAFSFGGAITSVSLLQTSGGSFSATDLTPTAFFFSGLDAGTYSLTIAGGAPATVTSYAGVIGVSSVPEPATLGLGVAALALLGAAKRRQKA